MEIDEILPGCKIDILEEIETLEGEKKLKYYKSSLFSVIDSDIIEIVAPYENNVLIPLHMGQSYNLVFFDNETMRKTEGVVVDRYRSGNFNLVRLHILKKLSKFQRREFFRIDCMIFLSFIELNDNENNTSKISNIYNKIHNRIEASVNNISYENGTIIDISGGGIRFTTDVNLNSSHKYLFIFDLKFDDNIRTIDIIGRVVNSEHLPDSDKYSHRIQFLYGDNKKHQDEIVKYIFEIERKRRRKEQ